jgi:hypothetical protein
MQRTMTDPNEPSLGIRAPGQEAIGSCEGILGYFKHARLNINGNDLSFVTVLHLWAYLSLVDLIATSGKFFSAVTWLSHSHHGFLLLT